jgi:glyoxylase-like metal-dependent hydrolase (beta-lactamase superfamily II)
MTRLSMTSRSMTRLSMTRRSRCGYHQPMAANWLEIGDRVWVRRYALYDQNIVVVRGGERTMVIDTRSTPAQARELIADIETLGIGGTDVVVNTHGHYDHAFGNRQFRPAAIWGHQRCVTMLLQTGEEQRRRTAEKVPEFAAGLATVVIDPPDRTFTDRAAIDLGDRVVDLAYLGRGHTDNDIVVRVPDADVLCAGDLLENGATPFFGDGYPLDWPGTVEAMLPMAGPATVVVPGHGDHAGRAFVERSLAELRALVELAGRVHRREVDPTSAAAHGPYPAARMQEPMDRALAQLRGELDG